MAGSSRNRQPWRFVATDDRERLDALAGTVFAPANLRACALAIAVAVPADAGSIAFFDVGRAAQNILLAAWSEGVGSCPNGMTDRERTAALLELEDGLAPAILISLGYPARPRDPAVRSPEEWLERANRLPYPLVRLPRRRPKDALAQHCCPDAALPWRPRSRVRAFAGSPALAR